MSYDICATAQIDLGGPEPYTVTTLGYWNYTSNCGPMWRAAGVDLAEFDGKTAGECLAKLQPAIDELKTNPAKYRAMDPPNGWGSYDTLLPALAELAQAFAAAPVAIVSVSH